MTSEADFVTMAIALGTDGHFGMQNADGSAIFQETDNGDYATLLSSAYEVTKNVDISYDTTGIISLNRNDKQDVEYAFSGSLRGKNGNVTITQNISAEQERVGIFSTITGANTFENLTISGTVSKAKGTGGLAYQRIDSGSTGCRRKKFFNCKRI